jgi:hypothetical protein
MKRDALPVCTTIDECYALDGKRMQLIGVYTPWNPSNPKARDPDRQAVRIQLGEDAGPLLEPYWDARAVRPPDELARLSGRRVQVVGVFRSTMPPDPSAPPGVAAAMGGSCIQSVESIALADKTGPPKKPI